MQADSKQEVIDTCSIQKGGGVVPARKEMIDNILSGREKVKQSFKKGQRRDKLKNNLGLREARKSFYASEA